MAAKFIEFEMYLRDGEVLEWIIGECTRKGGSAQIPHQRIAEQFGCDVNTAGRSMKRLVGARKIGIEDPTAKRGGFVYFIYKKAS